MAKTLIVRLGLCLLSVLLVAADCGNNPPPVYDGPASNLDLKVTASDFPDGYNDIPLVLQFIYNGNVVQFGSSTSVSCDGVQMTWNGLGQAGRVPRRAVGTAYGCTYTSGGVSTSVQIPVQPPPVISSPTQGSSVARSSNLSITYVQGTSAGIRGSASDANSAVGGNPDLQADSGSYVGINASSLQAGAGSIALTREFKDTIANTGFKSASYTYDAGSKISITWS